jgi:hypothetical protein
MADRKVYFLVMFACIVLAFILRDHYLPGSILHDGVGGIAPVLGRSAVVAVIALLGGVALDRQWPRWWAWGIAGFAVAFSATF